MCIPVCLWVCAHVSVWVYKNVFTHAHVNVWVRGAARASPQDRICLVVFSVCCHNALIVSQCCLSQLLMLSDGDFLTVCVWERDKAAGNIAIVQAHGNLVKRSNHHEYILWTFSESLRAVGLSQREFTWWQLLTGCPVDSLTWSTAQVDSLTNPLPYKCVFHLHIGRITQY